MGGRQPTVRLAGIVTWGGVAITGVRGSITRPSIAIASTIVPLRPVVAATRTTAILRGTATTCRSVTLTTTLLTATTSAIAIRAGTTIAIITLATVVTPVLAVAAIIATVLTVTAVVATIIASIIATAATAASTTVVAAVIPITTTVSTTTAVRIVTAVATAIATTAAIVETTTTATLYERISNFRYSWGRKSRLTALGRTEILARCWSAGAGTTSLFDAKSTTLNYLTLKTLLSRVGLLGGDHLDKAEATRLAAVGIFHDLALLHFAVLLKEARHLSLLETRVDASDEEVGARIDGTIIVLGARVVLDWRAEGVKSALLVADFVSRRTGRRMGA